MTQLAIAVRWCPHLLRDAKATAALKCRGLGASSGMELCAYESFTMACIRYKTPKDRFPPHIDHCDKSFVFLFSIGCTANFMVQGPGMDVKVEFPFHSGDVLVFDASTRAAILHGVTSIGSSTFCPAKLLQAFPVLQSHRFGIQCRLRF